MLFDKSILKQLWRVSTVGLNIVLSTVVGGVMGYFFDMAMDKWFGIKTAPWLLFIFTIIGIIAGFKELFMIAKKTENESKKNL
jgi:ATP synthase protein I